MPRSGRPQRRSPSTAPFAATFVMSDVLHGEQWEPHFGSADILQGLWALFEAAEACLSA
jgi:hypothetical protein